MRMNNERAYLIDFFLNNCWARRGVGGGGAGRLTVMLRLMGATSLMVSRMKGS